MTLGSGDKRDIKSDSMHRYIETVQNAVASLLKINDIDPNSPKYILFEILTRDQTGKQFFRPFVFSKIFSQENITGADLELMRDFCQSLKILNNNQHTDFKVNCPINCSTSNTKKCELEKDKLSGILQQLVNQYEGIEIDVNSGTTGVIFKAWQEGKLSPVRVSSNEQDNRSLIHNKLFIESDGDEKKIKDIMKLAFGLTFDSNDISDNWFLFEKLLIHKLINSDCYTIIHFPLIVDHIWFVGLAYIVVAGKSPQNPPMLLDKNKYFRCYDLLVNTVAEPLKWALGDSALAKFNEKLSIKENLINIAKFYFACFDVEKISNPIVKTNADWIEFVGLGIKIKMPNKSINNIFQEQMRGELDKLKEEIKNKLDIIAAARKAAVAQVMTRNVAHNIGSHVLGNLNDSIDDKVLTASRVKKLFQYLRIRHEFIADASTATSCILFNKKMNDVLSHFFKINGDSSNDFYSILLSDYISGKSDIKSVNIEIIYKNGSEDLLVSFPNDILGCHALYVILENIIRNAAKHSAMPDSNRKVKLSLTVNISDAQGDYYKIAIIDNLGESNADERSKNDFLKKLQDYTTKSILTENKLRVGGWGFLEMKICAAYLINYPLEEIDRYDKENYSSKFILNDNTYPPLLLIDLDDSHNLIISFHLLKPKLAHFYNSDREDGVISAVDSDTFRNLGISTGTIDPERGTPHEFLVIQAQKEINISPKNQRVIVINNEPDIKADTLTMANWLYGKRNMLAYPVVTNPDDSTPYESIVFDLHGDKRDNCQPFYYYEPHSSISLTKTMFIDPWSKADNTTKKKMEYEINEAAQTGIILLDERIQRAAEGINESIKAGEDPVSKIKLLEYSRVYMPDNNTPLGESKLNTDNVVCYIQKVASKEKPRYLAIHWGILEKMASEREKPLNSFVKYLETEYNLSVIVISGRPPSDFPLDILYVPFSIVFQYTISYRSKLMLTKVLMSIRRR